MSHIILHFLHDHFSDAWKAVSIIVTGAFGVLGLTTEFKNKHTKKITRWGWLSLIGIIVSSLCGVTAQLIESSNNARNALVLAQKSDETLNDIKRLLSPIGEPDITIQFILECETNPMSQFCDYLGSQGNYALNFGAVWGHWEKGFQGAVDQIYVNTFAKTSDPEAFVRADAGSGLKPDAWWGLSDFHDRSLSRGQKLSRRATEERGCKFFVIRRRVSWPLGRGSYSR